MLGGRREEFVHHILGVLQPREEISWTPSLLQGLQPVGAEVPRGIDVGHRSHQGAQKQVGMVLEHVDLHTETQKESS